MTARAFYGGTGGYTSDLPADRGLLAWTAPPHGASLAAAGALSAAGSLNIRRVRRVPAGPVTSIVMVIGSAGSGLTAGQCFAALFTAAGQLVAQTVDQAAAWASTGEKYMTLAAGPHTVAAGDYYVGVWFNGTASPTFYRATGGTPAGLNVGLTSPNLDVAVANSGLTTTAPATLSTQTATALPWWIALA